MGKVTDDLDVDTWLNEYYENKLTVSQLRPILSFTLLWNIFERQVGDEFSPSDNSPVTSEMFVDACLRVSTRTEQADKYLLCLTYFQDRYVACGPVREGRTNETNEDFEGLRLHESTRDRNGRLKVSDKETVSSMLLYPNSDNYTVVHGLFLIAQRIRNNLFHGNKTPSEFTKQTELFNVVNNLLDYYIRDLRL